MERNSENESTKADENETDDMLQFSPIPEIINNDLHLDNLNAIFKQIFHTLSKQNDTIMALRKVNRNLRSKHEKQTEIHAKIIDDLKIEITKLKDNTTEINSRMVTKADLLTQEIRLNQTASLNDLDELRM
jgi:hypothetical protein